MISVTSVTGTETTTITVDGKRIEVVERYSIYTIEPFEDDVRISGFRRTKTVHDGGSQAKVEREAIEGQQTGISSARKASTSNDPQDTSLVTVVVATILACFVLYTARIVW
jgi:hypothetical protein